MIEIKIAIVLICAALKFVGEIYWHDAQRFILPIVLAIGVSYVTGCWWLGLTVLPMIGPLTLGYKTYGSIDPLARGLWLFVICIVAGLGSVITHHLSLFFYIPICILAGTWGATTRNLWNMIIAPISGIIIGSLILVVHP